MAEVHPITGETPLRRYASRRRTPTPGGVEPVSRDKMAAPTSFQRGYDPDGMAWTTVTTSEAQNSAVPKFRHESLNEAVARRSLVQSKATMTSGPPAFKRQPPASRAAGSKGKALTNWKPCPFPKPGPDDFVVVIKPREHMWRHQAFSENRYGAAFTAYLGPEVARSVTVMPSREQNLIVIHTQNPAAADRLLGEFSIYTESEAIPLYGYLRQDGGDVCHGVIAVSNTDSNTETESLRQQVQWGAGTMVERSTCELCGQQAPLVEAVRAPHECVTRCSVCGGGHATNSRECAAKFRTHKTAAPKGGINNKIAAKKNSRHLGPPGKSPKAPSTGGAGKRTLMQPPPHGDTGKLSTAPPRGEPRAWLNAVKHGTQAMESEPAAPKAALSAEAALEARLEARMDARFNALETQISAAITSAIAKMTETIPTIVAQHIAQSSRGVRRTGGLIKDVSGRYPKTSRRVTQTELDDEDRCSLSGIENAPPRECWLGKV
ncbi:hypothetical protein HPB49_002781 [Dermacentor silvarum]|uniref:Uncharacterized protein n=1 Tax=Dermacentor silvarum TaxID=543639 RepID=A0ACB8CJ62_DERSI|nr:hypothetical protein HPB49_002781 [Dermacentor silvarum]